jgi:uncharacterized damage-inducible protein DinB
MNPDIRSIRNLQVRQFYALYWPQRQILYDFYTCLTEEQYDYRMVDRTKRKADTPRESLAHILYVQLVYMNGVKTGKLEFKSMGVETYAQMSKDQLLAEWERIDQEMLAYLTAEAFNNPQVAVFWGGMLSALDVLYFLRDHTILHVGWNLALMDHLSVPRYESLREYWG